MALFVVLLVIPPVLGMLSREWVAVAVPFFGWPTYYIGLNQRWWGENGTGDGWQWVAILLTIVGVLTTAAATQAGQRFAGRFAKPS